MVVSGMDVDVDVVAAGADDRAGAWGKAAVYPKKGLGMLMWFWGLWHGYVGR